MGQARPPEHAGDPLTIARVTAQLQRALTLRSPAVGADGRIDPRFSKDGDDLSPPLSWSGVPEAESFALVVEDPDAPGDAPFVHWLIWDIPGEATQLAQGIEAVPRPGGGLSGAVQGVNGFGDHGWGGPRPPRGHGVHHYHFQLFALSKRLGMGPETGLPELLNALKGVTLAKGELVGTYERPDLGEVRTTDTRHAPEPFAGKPGDEPRGAAVDPPRTERR